MALENCASKCSQCNQWGTMARELALWDTKGRGVFQSGGKKKKIWKPDGSVPVSVGGDRAILFLGVCSSKKRETVVTKCSWEVQTRGEEVSTLRTVEAWSRLSREVAQTAELTCMQVRKTDFPSQGYLLRRSWDIGSALMSFWERNVKRQK